ncbi:MAG: F0F1 ATP synthase subunit delta [Gammaproteobacteria bacterium]|nr:F0F1 ATP synthase subunit delta [Gammaproteobacteria bacterium]
MAELVTVARPYAQAVFDLARQTNTLALWSKALLTMAEVSASPDVKKIIGNPKVDQKTVGRAMADMCKGDKPKELLNFTDVLVEAGRLKLLPEMAVLFEALKAEAEKTVVAEVTSAFEIDNSQKEAIKAALKKRLGKEVEVSTTIDNSLIGGARIKAGDLVIDGSVKAQLSKLTTELTH